jgi:hypothetical protein
VHLHVEGESRVPQRGDPGRPPVLVADAREVLVRQLQAEDAELREARPTGQAGVAVEQLRELGTLDDEVVDLRLGAGSAVAVGGELVPAAVAEVERRVEGGVEEDRVTLGRQVERHDRRGLVRVVAARAVVVRHDFRGPVDPRGASVEAVAALDEALVARGGREGLRDHTAVPAHAARGVLPGQPGAVALAVVLQAQGVLPQDDLDAVGRGGRDREAVAVVHDAQRPAHAGVVRGIHHLVAVVGEEGLTTAGGAHPDDVIAVGGDGEVLSGRARHRHAAAVAAVAAVVRQHLDRLRRRGRGHHLRTHTGGRADRDARRLEEVATSGSP